MAKDIDYPGVSRLYEADIILQYTHTHIHTHTHTHTHTHSHTRRFKHYVHHHRAVVERGGERKDFTKRRRKTRRV